MLPSKRCRVESPKRRVLRLGRERSCAEQIETLPEPGWELLMMLDGGWHGWDLVEAVRQLAQCNIRHLRVATLGFNKTQARHIADLLDEGAAGAVSMVVGDFFQRQSKDEWEELRSVMEPRGQLIAATANHCKLMLFELEDGRTYSIHGSLNFRSCTCFEQMALSPDPVMHGFWAEYIDDAVKPAVVEGADRAA